MFLQDSSLLNALLATAATFLGLSLIVQVILEMYKYLTSSKSRAYRKVLLDFLGPWINRLLQPGIIPDLEIRGPFQIFRRRPQGKLLPLNKDDLIKALERTAPDWYQRALDVIKLEQRLQTDTNEQSPSQNWISFVKEVGSTPKEASGYWTASEIVSFLKDHGHDFPEDSNESADSIRFPEGIDAANLLASFRHEFLPHLNRVEEHHPKLTENFEYLYKRRNIRLTFVIGLFLAILANLPFDEIFRRASDVSAAEAVAIADRALNFYAAHASQSNFPDTTLTSPSISDSTILNQLRIAQEVLAGIIKRDGKVNYLINLAFLRGLWQSGWVATLRFLFGCLITSLLITFGAPFWNDMLGILTRLKKGK